MRARVIWSRNSRTNLGFIWHAMFFLVFVACLIMQYVGLCLTTFSITQRFQKIIVMKKMITQFLLTQEIHRQVEKTSGTPLRRLRSKTACVLAIFFWIDA